MSRPLSISAPLRPGDRVALVAPGSAPRDPAAFEAGLERFRMQPYDVEVYFHPSTQRGYLAAPDTERLQILNRCLRDPDLRAIFCVRGGYGTLRLLKRLDYAAARRHPKLLVGYSDITALQWALLAQAGWPSLSGPVLTEWHKLDPPTETTLQQLLGGQMPRQWLVPEDAMLEPLRPGQAEGPLIGGNLSVLSRLLGTPFCPSLDGALLFLEDVGEAPYRIDRMLAHLELAGVLDAVAGVLLGDFTDAETDAPSLSMDEVFADYFGTRPYPVVRSLPYGHRLPRTTMPIGPKARLDATHAPATLKLLEPVAR